MSEPRPVELPARRIDGASEEVDLALDVRRCADGVVRACDRDAFDRVRAARALLADVAARVEESCERARALVERRAEPFGDVGRGWLTRFLTGAGAPGP